MKEEENYVGDDEYDLNSSIFGESFVSKLKVK